MADMLPRTIKAAIIALLEAGADGAFYVVGSKKQSINAQQQLRTPRVMVNISRETFEATSNSYQVERDAEIAITLNVTLAEPARFDLTVLTNPSATAEAKAAALANSQDACDLANDKIWEISEAVYQIVEDARNYDLGLDTGTATNRHISDITPYQAQQDGQLIIANSEMSFTCTVTEEVDGEDGQAAYDVSDGIVDPNNEDTDNAGVIS